MPAKTITREANFSNATTVQNMPANLPSGDLARAPNHEANDEWPTLIEIVAYFPPGEGRKGKRRSIEIPADQFFGRKGYGAPISGNQIIQMIDQLRRGK